MHRPPLADVNGRNLLELSNRSEPRIMPNTNNSSTENSSLSGSLSLEPLLALPGNRGLRIIVDDWLRGLSITPRGGPSEEPVEIERPSSSLSNSTESSIITVISVPLIPPRDQENSPPPSAIPVADRENNQSVNASEYRYTQPENQQSR